MFQTVHWKGQGWDGGKKGGDRQGRGSSSGRKSSGRKDGGRRGQVRTVVGRCHYCWWHQQKGWCQQRKRKVDDISKRDDVSRGKGRLMTSAKGDMAHETMEGHDMEGHWGPMRLMTSVGWQEEKIMSWHLGKHDYVMRIRNRMHYHHWDTVGPGIYVMVGTVEAMGDDGSDFEVGIKRWNRKTTTSTHITNTHWVWTWQLTIFPFKTTLCKMPLYVIRDLIILFLFNFNLWCTAS
jgi:hypothetical protein